MIDKLIYKSFIGSVHYSAEDEMLFGKIEGINDLVIFEGNSVELIKTAFEEAVDDYIEMCNQLGKPVFKSFKGSFNVRIQPELHAKAYELALLEDKTLNQLVQEAVEAHVYAKKEK